ncbi:CHAT domain-containing protein [Verrucosispora sp. WMMA2044]|uniref:CHAT domain-containing protein n=1 Tax=Verrucosispora sp. WMMA2044 TaxID=3016419 RepID=UPI00248B3087|nr:CHAT domain-containing protein [Verrucosispora sp. WMMA2044]WBB50161.1 CHAT domain-containing protein [Verrucosispora sp. WMMA2044]
MTVTSRSLARDTMLTLAQHAEDAMVAFRNRDKLAVAVGSERAMFQHAVQAYLKQAASGSDETRADLDWSNRSIALRNAADILGFCAFMGTELPDQHDVEELYRAALAQLRPLGTGKPALDRLSEVTTTYRLVRSLRVGGRHTEALREARLDPPFYKASGAEPRIADVQFETGACLLAMGRPRQVFKALGESGEAYWEATEAAAYSTRHRYGFVLALAEQSVGEWDRAIQRMEVALEHLVRHRVPDTRHLTYELSLTLTLAETLAAAFSRSERAVTLAQQALDVAEQIRERWGVIARARTPLSRAIRRVYGDLALLAAQLRDSTMAAQLGLRVCLSAKQTGFASHLRAAEPLLPPRIRGLVTQALAAERLTVAPESSQDVLRDHRQQQDRTLAVLRDTIQRRINPMLADMIVPTATDVSDLLRALGARHALDLAGLPDSLAEGTNWFRTLITPTGDVLFDNFVPGDHFDAYFAGRGGQQPFKDRLHHDDAQPNWHALAVEILPDELLHRLRESATEENPLELLISAHQELSLLPWAALKVDEAGTRLVHRAVLTHTPALTCVSRPHPPAVSGPALVQLIAENDLWVEGERQAWNLPVTDGPIPLSRCALDGEPPLPTTRTRLSDELLDPEEGWRFVHIAAHGDGTGLDQYLALPAEAAGQLSAAQALALRWPESTLMASCHIGRVVNVAEAEPVGFVMAVLTGGSQCVVAAIDKVPDVPAGRMSRHLVQIIRGGGVRLDHALRRAQLNRAREHELSWALFNAYVR